MSAVLGILLPYLVLFYVVDSIRAVRKCQVLFFSRGGRPFRWRGAGLRMVGLSPAAQIIQAHCTPVGLTDEGVFLLTNDCASDSPPAGEEPVHLRFRDMGTARAEHTTVTANGRPLFQAPTRLGAMRWARTLDRLGRLSRQERGRHLAARTAAGFNAARLCDIRSKHRRLFLPVQVCSTALFAALFCMLPLDLALGPARFPTIDHLAWGILCLYALTVAVSLPVCRRVYRTEEARRRTFLLTMFLSPVTAVHALSNLSGDLYHRFDYLTIAGAVLSRDDFADLAGRELRKIRFRLGQDMGAPLQGHWRSRERAIRGLVKKMGLSAEELTGPPERKDSAAVAYCPVCLTQYREGYRTCRDCRVPLTRPGPEP